MNIEKIIDQGSFTLSSTSYGDISTCLRKGYYSHLLERVKAFQSHDLFFGQVLHHGLDLRHQHRGKDKSEVLAIIDDYVESKFENLELPEDEFRDMGRAKKTMGLYYENYASDIEQFNVIGQEEHLKEKLGTVHIGSHPVDVYWHGYLDSIWEDFDLDEILIKDTKTTKSADTNRKYDEFKMSVQLQMYCYLASKKFNRPVNKAIVDLIVLLKPLVRVTEKNKDKPRDLFSRFEVAWTDGQIQETISHILSVTQTFLQRALASSVPMNGRPRSCSWPSRCPYYEVCELPDEQSRMIELMNGPYVDKKTRF